MQRGRLNQRFLTIRPPSLYGRNHILFSDNVLVILRPMVRSFYLFFQQHLFNSITLLKSMCLVRGKNVIVLMSLLRHKGHVMFITILGLCMR